MEVKINKPAPVPTPQTTYDIVGLTRNEALIVLRSIGAVSVSRLRERDVPTPGAAPDLYHRLEQKLGDI